MNCPYDEKKIIASQLSKIRNLASVVALTEQEKTDVYLLQDVFLLIADLITDVIEPLDA